MVCLLVILQNVLAGQILHIDYFMYRFFIINVRQGWLTPLMQSISELAVPSVLLMVLITIQAFAPGRRPGFTVALNLVGVLLLNMMFEFFVHRDRPDGFRLIAETGYSFPSAHAMIAMAFYGFLAWLVWHYEQDRPVRNVSMVAYAFAGIMVGVSRIYLGAHYTSDVIAGFCLSFAWLAMFTAIVAPIALPRKRTSLGMNDAMLGAADKRDRRKRKPRHFQTARRLFAMGMQRTASRLAGEGDDAPAGAHTSSAASRKGSKTRAARTSRGEAEEKDAPRRRHSRTADVVNVMPTVEPRPVAAAATTTTTVAVAPQTAADEAADLRAHTTIYANAAAVARRNAAIANSGAIPMSPNTSGPIGPGSTGSFVLRPSASGPIATGRTMRSGNNAALRPGASGPIANGRKLAPSTTGSFAPIAPGTPAARRKLKPNTTGSFAAVRTVKPGATGAFPPVRTTAPGASGVLSPAPIAGAPTEGPQAAEQAETEAKAKRTQAAAATEAAPKAAAASEQKADAAKPETTPTSAPEAAKAASATEAQAPVVEAANVHVEDAPETIDES